MKVPRISMDYFFMSEADKKAHENPLIVMVDEETKEKYARAVGRKGIGTQGEMDWLIKDISSELKVWGHVGGDGSTLICKCDGESAITAVRDAVSRFHGGRVIPEAPAKGESQSNGIVEEAGKTIREYTRVMKDQIEHNANIELKPEDVVTLWMVRWAAMLVSRYVVGRDGKTGYERRRGRRCKIPVVPFGEKVWYKELRETKERKNKFDCEWHDGIWLGHSRCSNEILIGTRGGVVRAYAVKRREEDARWDGKFLKELTGTPQKPNPSKPGMHIPVKIRFDKDDGGLLEQEVEDKEVIRKRFKITKTMLESYD